MVNSSRVTPRAVQKNYKTPKPTTTLWCSSSWLSLCEAVSEILADLDARHVDLHHRNQASERLPLRCTVAWFL